MFGMWPARFAGCENTGNGWCFAFEGRCREANLFREFNIVIQCNIHMYEGDRKDILFVFPQQRKLMGSSAQTSSGVCRCGSQEQVPEEGSGRFRKVPESSWQVPEGSGRYWRVLVCAGVGSEGWFRKVPEGSGRFRFRTVLVCSGSGEFRCVAESSGACWCGLWRQGSDPESSGVVCCLATLTGAAMWLFRTHFGDGIVHMGKASAQKEGTHVVKHGIKIYMCRTLYVCCCCWGYHQSLSFLNFCCFSGFLAFGFCGFCSFLDSWLLASCLLASLASWLLWLFGFCLVRLLWLLGFVRFLGFFAFAALFGSSLVAKFAIFHIFEFYW